MEWIYDDNDESSGIVAVLQLVVQGRAAVLWVAAVAEAQCTVHAAVKTSRVGRPITHYTTLFYFQQCPESPNGERIVYTSLQPEQNPRAVRCTSAPVI